MSEDDKRMHGDNTPGLVPGRGHERHEEPVAQDDAIGWRDESPRKGDQRETEKAGSTTDGEQESVLGGRVATRSGSAETPKDERFD